MINLFDTNGDQLHPLLKDSDLGHKGKTIFLNVATKTPVLLPKDDDDPTLQRLTQQLVNHLESMQSNVGQLEKVKYSLPRSKAVLDDLLRDPYS
jgi:hypothetical protein